MGSGIPWALALLVSTASGQEAPPQEVVDWMTAHAVPIDTSALPRSAPADESWLRLAGDARVLFLGEGTHGTLEFTQVKDRWIQWLARENGLDAVVWESDVATAFDQDDLLARADGDVAAATELMRGFPWKTREVEALLEGIRARRAEGGKPRFVGIDIFGRASALERALAALDRLDSDAGASQQRLLEELVGGDLSAKLATKGALEEALDGLDLVETRRFAEAAELLVDRLSASGAAWEDVLAARSVEQRTRHLIQFYTLVPDFGYERADEAFGANFSTYAEAPGRAQRLSGFLARTDPQALAPVRDLLSRLGSPREALRTYRDELGPAARHGWRESMTRLATRFEVRGDQLEAGAAELELALDDVHGLSRLLEAFHESLRLVPEREIVNLREQSLADNTVTVLEALGGGARVVLSAHNFHGNRAQGPEGGVTSGTLLARRLGQAYVSVGMLFGRGGFQAIDLERARRESGKLPISSFEVPDPPSGSLEEALARVPQDAFALDLRRLPESGPVADWFAAPREVRHIGNSYDASRPEDFFFEVSVREQFDVLVFFQWTTRAEPTDGARVRYAYDLDATAGDER